MAQSKSKNLNQKISQDADINCEGLLLENQICFAIYTASRMTTQAYQPYLEPFDLTYLQYLVMLVLWEKDTVTVSELGKSLKLDSGTLSPLLKKLESKKLVVRERQLKDERSVLIKLTSFGFKLKFKVLHIREKMICDAGMPMSDLGKLKQQLELLSDNLHHAHQSKISN